LITRLKTTTTQGPSLTTRVVNQTGFQESFCNGHMDHEEDPSEWGSRRFYPLSRLRGGSVYHCNEEVRPEAGEMMMIMGGHLGGGRDSVSSQ